MNMDMICVVCGQPTPVHVAAADLFRTGVCVVRCEKCAAVAQEAFDRWQASRIGKDQGDVDLEAIDDRYAAEMAKKRSKGTPKFKEGR